MSRKSPNAPRLSVVVPLFNEAATLDELHENVEGLRVQRHLFAAANQKPPYDVNTEPIEFIELISPQ